MHIEDGGGRLAGGEGPSAMQWRRGAHTRTFTLISSFFLTLINSAQAYRAGFTDPTLNRPKAHTHTHIVCAHTCVERPVPRVCVLWLASVENWTITLCALRFVSSASFDYYTPKYLRPPPLKTAIKSSDPRCAWPRNSEVYFRGSCSDARNSHGTVIIIFSEINLASPPPPLHQSRENCVVEY